jgi:uncharacterized protein
MIIDGHINITKNGKWFKTKYDASLDRLLMEMNEAGIDKCLLISMPFATSNKYIASVIEKYPDKFRGLGQIDFTNYPDRQIEEVYSMGFSGLKLHPRIQGIDCNSSELQSFWAKLNDINAVIMIDGYFQTYNTSILLREIEPFKYDPLVKRYPNITFIFSHLFAHRVFDAYYLVKSNKNVFLDNSHVLKYFENTSLIADYIWIMDKLDEKIIYGSDFPEYGIKEYLNRFSQIIESNSNVRKDLILSNIQKIIKF